LYNDFKEKIMKKFNYCLTHKCATEFPVGNTGEGCVIVSSPPPEDNRLIGDFDAPDAEELAQMDANAEELRNDFTGA
jgi:hypothetical protein